VFLGILRALFCSTKPVLREANAEFIARTKYKELKENLYRKVGR
jgi:hypothetical protein